MKKYVNIELDKPRHLRYGVNSIIQLEEHFGKPISELDTKKLSFADMRAMLWAGLIHEEKDLTHETSGDLMDEAESLQYLAEKITEAMQVAFGGKKEEKNVKVVAK